VDVTLGSALRAAAAEEPFLEHLRKGGLVMVPLGILAVLCALVAIIKSVTVRRVDLRAAEGRIGEVLTALADERVEQARETAARLPQPLGPVVIDGIDHRDSPKEHLEEIMYERILAQVPGLERHLSTLAVCASTAPLLGLLGTVTGMIHTFRLITVFGAGDAQLLSAGISEALITTKFGLAIAIPALLMHAYLSRRVRRTVAATQQACIMFVNGLKLRRQPDAGNGDDH